MPSGSLYGVRSKYIHSVGNVAQAKFVSSGNHPFTGIFKGADNALIRLSLAQQPNTKVEETAPGLGFKALRDGVDSCNFVVMYSVDG